jgi:hypothetical protein
MEYRRWRRGGAANRHVVDQQRFLEVGAAYDFFARRVDAR